MYMYIYIYLYIYLFICLSKSKYVFGTLSAFYLIIVSVIECPSLEAPTNGALACTTWIKGRICQVECNEGYDISEVYATAPAGFGVGLYSCNTITGDWTPDPPAPECSGKLYD